MEEEPKSKPAPARPKREVKLKYFAPLIYAPLLQGIRITFRKSPRLRDALFGAGVLTALCHGAYLILFDLDMDAGDRLKERK
jgi:hypothetical protein